MWLDIRKHFLTEKSGQSLEYVAQRDSGGFYSRPLPKALYLLIRSVSNILETHENNNNRTITLYFIKRTTLYFPPGETTCLKFSEALSNQNNDQPYIAACKAETELTNGLCI